MYIKVENSNARAGSIDTRRLVELEHLCVVLKVQGCDIGVFFSVRGWFTSYVNLGTGALSIVL